jgi:hypothetical protein
MSLARGVLYEHALRPEWGHGLLLARVDHKLRIAFTDGTTRTLLPSEHLREVAAPPKPKREPKVRRVSRAGGRPPLSPWTDADDLELVAGVTAGLCDAELAAKLFRTRRAVAKRRQRLGVEAVRPARATPVWPPELVWLAIEAAQRGATLEEIAVLVDRPITVTRDRMRKAGITFASERCWTASEDQRLHNSPHATHAELAEALGRSHGAVRWRRAQIGAAYEPASGRPWTPEEERWLMHCRANGATYKQLAGPFRRSASALKTQVKKINARPSC